MFVGTLGVEEEPPLQSDVSKQTEVIGATKMLSETFAKQTSNATDIPEPKHRRSEPTHK